MGCLVICREEPQLAVCPALVPGSPLGAAPRLASGRKGPGPAGKRLVIDAVTVGRPVFVSGQKVPPAWCRGTGLARLEALRPDLQELGSPRGWGRVACSGVIALCLLVLLW